MSPRIRHEHPTDTRTRAYCLPPQKIISRQDTYSRYPGLCSTYTFHSLPPTLFFFSLSFLHFPLLCSVSQSVSSVILQMTPLNTPIPVSLSLSLLLFPLPCVTLEEEEEEEERNKEPDRSNVLFYSCSRGLGLDFCLFCF